MEPEIDLVVDLNAGDDDVLCWSDIPPSGQPAQWR
jgi:hypothetical protein